MGNKVCPYCGAHLDLGEVCDCSATQNNNERFNVLLNGCRHPRAVYAALLSLASTGPLDKKEAPAGAANAGEGGVEQITTAVSTSNDT
ncbi:MAG: hypothetical protein K2P08_00770 [Oscillospiraceae bacterium]|nr:hypothetical protein [Oscillospiraceae bacterium]